MKQHTAEILNMSRLIREVSITRTDAGWVVALFGQDGAAIAPGVPVIETARGEVRTWASLDTAHRWVETLLGDDRDPGMIVTIGW